MTCEVAPRGEVDGGSGVGGDEPYPRSRWQSARTGSEDEEQLPAGAIAAVDQLGRTHRGAESRVGGTGSTADASPVRAITQPIVAAHRKNAAEVLVPPSHGPLNPSCA